MEIAAASEPSARIPEIMLAVQRKGVKLWSSEGRLHYEAPKGTLTREDMEQIRNAKEQIIALLQAQAANSHTAGEGAVVTRAPLSFTQRAHWSSYELFRRPSARQVFSAIELRGRLNLNALQGAADRIVERHHALRTRIVNSEGIPLQEVMSTTRSVIQVSDLRSPADGEARTQEIDRQIRDAVLDPVNLATDPLFEIRVLRLGDKESVLIVALDHVISDAASLAIMIRELLTGYAIALTGRPSGLPPVQTQFPRYALEQSLGVSGWKDRHDPYYSERLEGCERVRFSEDTSVSAGHSIGWMTVPIRIPSAQRNGLELWCRQRRTTLATGAFAVYVALVMKWCGTRDAVFQFQTAGRDRPELENTIGYLASALRLRIKLSSDLTFSVWVGQIMHAYCDAFAHADHGYYDTHSPKPAFAHNTCFNWIPMGREPSVPELDGSEYALDCATVPIRNPIVDHFQKDAEPFVELFDKGTEVIGDLYFPVTRMRARSMERFVADYLSIIGTLLARPDLRVEDVELRHLSALA